MTLTTDVDFWLRFVEMEGGGVERSDDDALALLPGHLVRDLDLPEMVTVTADPEVSREDGAVLLVTGHPILEHAAKRVLDAGDVGHHRVAWPDRPSPSADVLLQSARDRFPIDQGRIDLGGPPSRVYLPVIRVAATVTYTVDDRFQERGEVCLDGHSGLPLAADLGRRLAGLHAEPRPDGVEHLAADLPMAMRRVHALLEEQAVGRAHDLAAMASGSLRDETERADTYYAETLASIARRRAGATPDRQELFDAQADAVRAEQERRRQEIGDKFHVRHEILPFRLHVIEAPALALPVHIRRGERRRPLRFFWLMHDEVFVDTPCPHCGDTQVLRSGRERLGCRGCLPRPMIVAPPAVTAKPANARRPDPEATRPRPTPLAPVAAAPVAAAPKKVTAEKLQAPMERSTTWVGDLRRPSRKIEKAADKAQVRFWRAAGLGERPPSSCVATRTPLGILVALFGAAAPFHALDLPPRTRINGYSTKIDVLGSVALGHLEVGREHRFYSLRFGMTEDGGALLTELLPWQHGRGAELPYFATSGFPGDVPRPSGLDDVGGLLWDIDYARVGLWVTARSLAAWARLRMEDDVPARVIAAALSSAMGWRAGLRRPRATVAAAYGADPSAVARMAKSLPAGLLAM